MKADPARKSPSLAELEKDYAAFARPLKTIRREQAKSGSSADRFASVTPPLSRQERGKAFSSWLRKEAPGCGLDVQFDFVWDTDKGGGLVATRDLPQGTPFISVPRKLCLSVESAMRSPVGALLHKDPLCHTMPNLSLAVHIMFEALNPASYWAPYLAILPRSFSLPLFYDRQGLDLLRGSSVYEPALRMHVSTIRQYVHFVKLFRQAGHLSLPPFSFDDFRWAVAVVMSRQNRVPSSAGVSASSSSSSTLALIPGWDMCNFADGTLSTEWDTKADASVCKTMTGVKKGEQIYIYYGDRPNSKLFLYQGFVVQPCRADTVEFNLSLDPSDPMFKIRKLMLVKRKLSPSQRFHVYPEATVSPELMQFLRIGTLTKETATLLLKTPSLKQISGDNEIAALQWLVDELEQRMKSITIPSPKDDEKKQSELVGVSSAQLDVLVRWLTIERDMMAATVDNAKACIGQIEQMMNEQQKASP